MTLETKIHFLGASRTVTGSKYLIEHNNHKVLIDCGLFQGKKELRDRNWAPFPIPAHTIDAMILTHAHLDHTGYIPRLVRQGFRGPIYCTPATQELTKFILLDSAHLQEEEAKHANKHKTSKHKPALPLYTTEDAEAALELFRPIPRDKVSDIFPDISVLPQVAGHILGACTLSITVGTKKISFSGDIGRYDVPLLPDPKPIEIGELLLCESTYGDRLHSKASMEAELEKVIIDASKKSGPLLIPAFSIGRTQHLLYTIRKLEEDNRIPIVPIYVDSPMGIDATEIYQKYSFDFDEDNQHEIDQGKNILETKKTYFTRTVDESKKLNSLKGPFTVIAGSGMATGGRILHHLKHWISNPETTVLFVGFQAEDTRGARLLAGEPTIKMYGEIIPVRAEIKNISGLSAHGDRDELTKWLKSCTGTPNKVKIVHGEPVTADSFAKHLKQVFEWNASPAEYMEIVKL